MRVDRERFLRWAAASIVLGLTVEILTLKITHPTSFLAFILIGGTLVGLGVVAYVSALLWGGGTRRGGD